MPTAVNRSNPDTLTIRIERELKDEFISAARTQNRPASEVLRDLMQAYVEDEKESSSRQRHAASPS